jgi:hypothetical protein
MRTRTANQTHLFVIVTLGQLLDMDGMNEQFYTAELSAGIERAERGRITATPKIVIGQVCTRLDTRKLRSIGLH